MGSIIRVGNGDTRSLDYSSHQEDLFMPVFHVLPSAKRYKHCRAPSQRTARLAKPPVSWSFLEQSLVLGQGLG